MPLRVLRHWNPLYDPGQNAPRSSSVARQNGSWFVIILSWRSCDRIYDILDSFYCSFVYRYPAPGAETSAKLGKLVRSRLSCHSASTTRRLLIKRDACGTRCLISRSDFAAFYLAFYSPLFTALRCILLQMKSVECKLEGYTRRKRPIVRLVFEKFFGLGYLYI